MFINSWLKCFPLVDGIFPTASIFNNPWIISRIPLWLSPSGGISSTAAAPLDQMPIRADHQVVACHSAAWVLGGGRGCWLSRSATRLALLLAFIGAEPGPVAQYGSS